MLSILAVLWGDCKQKTVLCVSSDFDFITMNMSTYTMSAFDDPLLQSKTVC